MHALVPGNPLRRFSDDLLTKKVKWSMINTARNTTHFMVPSTPTFFPICWVGFDAARNRHLWSGGYVTLHVLFHRDAYLACTQINIRTIWRSWWWSATSNWKLKKPGRWKSNSRNFRSLALLLWNGVCLTGDW